ncbi:hypothetical protein D3C77_308990 [compost metagenome]
MRDKPPLVGRLANDLPCQQQIRLIAGFDAPLDVGPDRGGLVGERVRHPFTAIVITQQLRVDRDRLDKTAHPLGALAQPDIGIASVAGGAIFAAAYELLEQGEGELWGQAIELLNGPDQIALTRSTNECGVKIDAGQRVGEKVDTLPQGLFGQR